MKYCWESVYDSFYMQRQKTGDLELWESIKKNSDFRNVYNGGKSYANKYLVMYVLQNGWNTNRIGISVSKKVGNSVVRHRVIRLIRESYRLNEDMFNNGLDIVIVARANAKDRSYNDISNALIHLGSIHKILKEMILS